MKQTRYNMMSRGVGGVGGNPFARSRLQLLQSSYLRLLSVHLPFGEFRNLQSHLTTNRILHLVQLCAPSNPDHRLFFVCAVLLKSCFCSCSTAFSLLRLMNECFSEFARSRLNRNSVLHVCSDLILLDCDKGGCKHRYVPFHVIINHLDVETHWFRLFVTLEISTGGLFLTARISHVVPENQLMASFVLRKKKNTCFSFSCV